MNSETYVINELAIALQVKCNTLYGVEKHSDKMEIYSDSVPFYYLDRLLEWERIKASSPGSITAMNGHYKVVLAWVSIHNDGEGLLATVTDHDYVNSVHHLCGKAEVKQIVEAIWPAFVAAVHRHEKHKVMVSSLKCPYCSHLSE